MRHWLKFGHSMTAISFLGAVIVLWVMIDQLPLPEAALDTYVAQRQLMERIASLVLMPSLLMSLLFGLASMAAVPGFHGCLLYTSPSPRDRTRSRMPSSA